MKAEGSPRRRPQPTNSRRANLAFHQNQTWVYQYGKAPLNSDITLVVLTRLAFSGLEEPLAR